MNVDDLFPGPDKPLGEVTVSVQDNWTTDTTIIRAEQVIPATPYDPVRTVAAWIPVTRQAMADAAVMQSVLPGAFDRHLRPWRYPDRNPMPTFVPFPRLERATVALRSARRRLAEWRAGGET